MNVYFISGIGADYRLFTHLRLPEGYKARYVHWIPPLGHEPLADYAFRLTGQIDTTKPFVLVGLSLGGIMAVEIAKRTPPVCTILISSVPLSAQLPPLYKIAGSLKLNRLVPASIGKIAAIIKHSLTLPGAENRRLMRQVIRDGDNGFIRWALTAVLEWRNGTIPSPFFHLHGTRDEVFPIRRTHPTHVVAKGDHNFVLSVPETVNQFLHEILLPFQKRTPA